MMSDGYVLELGWLHHLNRLIDALISNLGNALGNSLPALLPSCEQHLNILMSFCDLYILYLQGKELLSCCRMNYYDKFEWTQGKEMPWTYELLIVIIYLNSYYFICCYLLKFILKCEIRYRQDRVCIMFLLRYHHLYNVHVAPVYEDGCIFEFPIGSPPSLVVHLPSYLCIIVFDHPHSTRAPSMTTQPPHLLISHLVICNQDPSLADVLAAFGYFLSGLQCSQHGQQVSPQIVRDSIAIVGHGPSPQTAWQSLMS